MDRNQLWKNFDLGQELNIAGSFIYEGLRCFHEMSTLENADEIFDFLYRVSVGTERLLKVAVVLCEHGNDSDQQEFEASLITHNHPELLKRVRAHQKLPLGSEHNEFLDLLGTFYRTLRYDRFTVAPSWNPDKEKSALRAFLEKRVDDLGSHPVDCALRNSNGAKRHIEKLVRAIATAVYAVVCTKARELNLNSQELREGSKAQRLFVKGQFTFLPQDILRKELLVFFMNTKGSSGLLNLLRSTQPLEFDPGLTLDYVRAFLTDHERLQVEDEVHELYDQMEKAARDKRLSLMDIIGNPSIDFVEDNERAENSDEDL